MGRRRKPEDVPAEIAARNLGPEIELLKSFGIPGARIAFLVGDTHDNIRQIGRRAQQLSPLEITVAGLRKKDSRFEELPLYGQKHRRLEEQEWEVEMIFQKYASLYQFSAGAEILGAYLRKLSAPTHPKKIRLLARIHHHLAWFSIQQGKCRSALKHGEYSLWLSRELYKESWDKIDLNRYVETALIVSMAAHLSAEGMDKSETDSLVMLWLAKEAAEAAGNPRGSEHFRQRGSALWNLGEYDEARKAFLEAMERAREKNEARDENHVKMIGERFLHLLGKSPDWEGAQELLQKVKQTFGRNSLEYAININYTAAAGLLTHDPIISKKAVDLLQSSIGIVAPFGRQATVTKLLSITPDLKLDHAQIRRWIKQALRANALRKL
jgi:tetratricopeptide (TPR) repeat protein